MHAFVDDFDSRLKKELSYLGVDFNIHKRIGAAVSGGADSISLLTSLSHIVPDDVDIFVITVNHNLREKKDTEGDAEFVQSYCKKMNIHCKRVDIPRGDILKQAEARNIGVEAAAREARYNIFADFAKEFNVSHICLAHNKNDQVETVLMRFLHGSGSESLSGIPMKRDLYIRPLLNVGRSDIEYYLELQKIEYCTDKTNFETVMLRNCIRNAIMPILDKECSGWQKAVLSLSAKMKDDETVLHSMAEKAYKNICCKRDDVIILDMNLFCEEPRAIQRRILFMAFSAIGADSRIPYRLVSSVMNHLENKIFRSDIAYGNVWKEESSGVSVTCNGSNIFVQKQKKIATESGFFVIIEEVGSYKVGNCFFDVKSKDGDVIIAATNDLGENTISLKNLDFPFAIRSRQPGDEIRNSSGGYTSVMKILNDWKCGSVKDFIPVVQSLSSVEQDLICIWGEAFGFKNWIVRN